MLGPLAYHLLTLIPLIAAQTAIRNGGKGIDAAAVIPPSGSTNGTAANAIVGVLCIVLGLLFTFYGRRVFKITLFFGGFFAFAVVTYSLIAHFEPVNPDGRSAWGDNRELIALCVCAGVGLVGGLLAHFVFKAGLFLVGGMAGFATSVFVLSWMESGTIGSEWGRIVFILVCVVIGGLLAIMVEAPLLVLATAVGGAFAVMFGIDVFADAGFAQAAKLTVSGQMDFYRIKDKSLFGLLIGMVLLALLGIFTQFKLTSKSYDRKRRVRHHEP